MRQPLSFASAGAWLAGTLDSGDRATGLLIVTGGSQTRAGPHRWQAELARQLAGRGFPVFRFDRRGIGDSTGADEGFLHSGPDIMAAAAALRDRCPSVRRIAGLGLCDGATALALHHREAGITSLLLANPWLVEAAPGLPPPAAIRRHYLRRLASPADWRRLLSGRIDMRKAARGAASAALPSRSALARRTAAALTHGDADIRFILSTEDATAIAFADQYAGPAFAALRRSGRAACIERASASHSFAHGGDPEWLVATITAELERIDADQRSDSPPCTQGGE